MRFSCGRPVCFRGTYLSNTRMHFADIWFVSHSFWKYIIHRCFEKYLQKCHFVCTNHSDIVKISIRTDCCLNVATITVCSSSRAQHLRTTEGLREWMETMGRGIQDMNNMNRWTVWALWAGRSLRLSPHLTFPCTPLPARIYLVTSNRVRTILALNIFATFWQELLAPLTGWNMSV